MKVIVRVSWEKVFEIEMETETDDREDLAKKLKANDRDTIEGINELVGERYDNPSEENFTYSLAERDETICELCGSDLDEAGEFCLSRKCANSAGG